MIKAKNLNKPTQLFNVPIFLKGKVVLSHLTWSSLESILISSKANYTNNLQTPKSDTFINLPEIIIIHWMTYNIQFAQDIYIKKITNKFSKTQIMSTSQIKTLITGFQEDHPSNSLRLKFLMLDKTLFSVLPINLL